MFLRLCVILFTSGGGVSVQRGGLCSAVFGGGGLCLGGFSVYGGLCPGGLCPGEFLSGRLPYGNVRAVHILLECILLDMSSDLL